MHVCNLNCMPDIRLLSEANFGAACRTTAPHCALYPDHSGDPAPTLASGAWLALVAEGREPEGPAYHLVASGDLLAPLTSEQTLLLEPNLLPRALGA